MMNDMIDRVATAIIRKATEIGGHVDASDVHQVRFDGDFDVLELAHAAIAAMKNPTADMRYAGRNTDPFMLPDIWNNMIDEALKGEPPL